MPSARCLTLSNTLEKGKIRWDSVAKIHHYVWIARRKRKGYGLEGIRAQHDYSTILWKERCMGKPESTPNHKLNECTREKLIHKAQIFERVCEKERCMGKPELSPRHNTNECMRKEERWRKEVSGVYKREIFVWYCLLMFMIPCFRLAILESFCFGFDTCFGHYWWLWLACFGHCICRLMDIART